MFKKLSTIVTSLLQDRDELEYPPSIQNAKPSKAAVYRISSLTN